MEKKKIIYIASVCTFLLGYLYYSLMAVNVILAKILSDAEIITFAHSILPSKIDKIYDEYHIFAFIFITSLLILLSGVINFVLFRKIVSKKTAVMLLLGILPVVIQFGVMINVLDSIGEVLTYILLAVLFVVYPVITAVFAFMDLKKFNKAS